MGVNKPTIIERDHYLMSLLDRLEELEEKVRRLEEKIAQLSAT